jgi:hypothetical protein
MGAAATRAKAQEAAMDALESRDFKTMKMKKTPRS